MLRLFLFLNFLTLSAFCESELYTGNKEIQKALNENMYEPNYFSMLLGLATVIVLVYLTAYVYQKLLNFKITKTDIPNKIEILSTTSLGQNKNLHIIKAENKKILIGSTQANITFIKDLEEN